MAEMDEINKHLDALENLTGLAGSDGKGYNTNMNYDMENQAQCGGKSAQLLLCRTAAGKYTKVTNNQGNRTELGIQI